MNSFSVQTTEREAIEAYFNSGFEYQVMLLLLSKYHDPDMSLSTLNRRLKDYDLRRNGQQNINMVDLERIIRRERDGPLQNQNLTLIQNQFLSKTNFLISTIYLNSKLD